MISSARTAAFRRTSLTRVHQQLSGPSSFRRDLSGYESEPEMSRSQRDDSAAQREARLLSELRETKQQLETMRRQRDGDVFDINLRYSAADTGRRRHRSQQESSLIDPPLCKEAGRGGEEGKETMVVWKARRLTD